ncbi:YesL family protein [Bacillus sp. JJ1562]|uniref:YesL family protein n=1 Tax=Bacillus sp. JJ1562 TaxID=3122960 RepID=UPI0030013B87
MRYDGKFFRGLEIAGNLAYLNALFIISSLPIVTIAPAWLAMMGVIREWSQKNDPPITSTFFTQFKASFRKGLAVSIVQLIIFAILVVDFFVILNFVEVGKEFILPVIILITIIVVSMFIYMYPLVLNYKMNVKQLVKNSFYLSFYKPFSILAILFFLVVLVMLSTVFRFLPFLCAFSVFTYVYYVIIERSLQRIEEKIN